MLRKIAAIVFALALFVAPWRAMGAESGHTPQPEAPSGSNAPAEHPKKGLLTPEYNTAIWVVVIFVVMLAILYPTAWKKVLDGLKVREERIRKDISDAEAARAKAEETLKAYNAQLATAQDKAREMVQKAIADGEQLATQIRTRAQQEAEEARERATRDIEAARKQAIIDIREQAAELSTRVAEKILRRNLNVDDQRDLVRSSLAQLQDVNRG